MWALGVGARSNSKTKLGGEKWARANVARKMSVRDGLQTEGKLLKNYRNVTKKKKNVKTLTRNVTYLAAGRENAVKVDKQQRPNARTATNVAHVHTHVRRIMHHHSVAYVGAHTRTHERSYSTFD